MKFHSICHRLTDFTVLALGTRHTNAFVAANILVAKLLREN